MEGTVDQSEPRTNVEGLCVVGMRQWGTVHSASLHDQLSNIRNAIVGEVSAIVILYRYFNNLLLKW
jgi:hypothetical protein